MKLYLARHGRTNYNDHDLCNYEPAVDVHLTPTGIEQSKALADKLKHTPLDHLFASELKRTQQTAEIVDEFHGLKIALDARLNDIVSGFEGKPFQSYVAALAAAPDKWTARFHGGESIEDMKQRAADFISELRTKQYDCVLVVTSQWIIYGIVAFVNGLSNEEAWDLALEQGNYLEIDV